MAKISDELLEILRCPVTGSTLVQQGQALISSAPGPDGKPVHYAIDEGIALLLRPEQLAS
ncbi:MAG: hypothetical protein WBX27_15075 [Specibacter sp.]